MIVDTKLTVPALTVAAVASVDSEVPYLSIVVGLAAFILTRIVVSAMPSESLGKWWRDMALSGVLILGLLLAILGLLLPPPLDQPLGPGTSFILGVGVAWGGLRSLELTARIALGGYRAAIRGDKPVDKGD